MTELPSGTNRAQIIDRSGKENSKNAYWEPVIVTKSEIEQEIARLSSLPPPFNGRRRAIIAHPMANPQCPGLAPGIQVTLNVLNPGEQTDTFRHNATEVNFCIRGKGKVSRRGETTSFSTNDVWNMPSYVPYSTQNLSEEPLVWLNYSNAPLLQFLQARITESEIGDRSPEQEEGWKPPAHDRTVGSDDLGQDGISIGHGGAKLLPYERLINPKVVQSDALHWPWHEVEEQLEKLSGLDKSYVGRRLYLLYNPATGRTNGTTQNFFATITIRPPRIIDRPHRHVSAAINYYFQGSGYSVVEGKKYEWGPGDLMLSAPPWAVHNHASHDEYVYELTVQDQPLAIAMDALLWQENLKRPPHLLGSQYGFETNKHLVE